MNLTIEEALRTAQEKAGALRYLSDLASGNDVFPGPTVLSGLASILGEIEDTLRRARRSLDPEAMSRELKR